MAESPYLTIAQVADELQMTTSGVYKLIQRDRLPAVRHSERGTRIARWALDAYLRRLQGERPNLQRPVRHVGHADLRDTFARETGLLPEQWIAAWKQEHIEDSAENTALLVRALGLRDDGRNGRPDTEPAQQSQSSASGKFIPASAALSQRPVEDSAPKMRALELIRANPGITVPQLAKMLGVKEDYLHRVVPGLAEVAGSANTDG